MNLKSSPTKEQLVALFAACDDEHRSHMLWVGEDGEVHVDPIPPGLSPVGYFRTLTGVRFRYETFHRGNGYVGAQAAADDEHVTEYLDYLVRDWREGLRGYSDDFAIR